MGSNGVPGRKEVQKVYGMTPRSVGPPRTPKYSGKGFAE